MILSTIKSKIQQFALLGLSAILIALGVAAGIQYLKIKDQAVEIKQLTLNLEVAVAANKENVSTIAALKLERDKANGLATRRLADKDKLIDDIRRTCELKGGSNVSNITVVPAPGNDILDALNRMLPQAAGGDGSAVHQAADPAAAPGAPLQPGELVYCLREVDAKNLMINFAMCRAWGGDTFDILSTYTGTK